MAKAKAKTGKLPNKSKRPAQQKRVRLALGIAPGQLWCRREPPGVPPGTGMVIVQEVTVSAADARRGGPGPLVRIVTASGSELTRSVRMREFLQLYDLNFDPRGVWRSKRNPGWIVSVEDTLRGNNGGPIARTTTLRGYAAAAIPISELRSSWERTDGISLQELVRGVAAHDFGWALVQLREGKRVARAGWNGKGMWLVLVEGTAWRANVRTLDELGHVRFATLPWIGMKTANNGFVPWLASQTDMLAGDWGLA